MAEQVTRVCDWKDWHDDQSHDVCGKPAPADVTANVDGHTLSGDLCPEHRDELIDRLRRIAGLRVDQVRIDSKPRHTYVTDRGKIVASKDIRVWALAERKIRSSHGRLAKELIEEYLVTH